LSSSDTDSSQQSYMYNRITMVRRMQCILQEKQKPAKFRGGFLVNFSSFNCKVK